MIPGGGDGGSSGDNQDASEGGTITYDADTVAVIGDNQYKTLQGAYNAANDGDTIVLLSNIDLETNFHITKKVTIDLGGHTVNASSGLPAFHVYGAGDLTLKGSGTVNGSSWKYGGVIYITKSDSTGITGTVTLEGDVLLKNDSASASAYGGAVYNYGGTFNMSGGTIQDISAYCGGAVYNYGGTFNMSGGTIRNTSAGWGGAVYNYGGTFHMTGGTIDGSSATSYGGAISNTGTLIIENGIIQNSTAKTYGGGIYSTGPVTVTDSTISGNTATSSGGGIYARGNLTLTNTTIEENKGSSGGGIYMADNYASFEKAAISGCRITGNTAMSSGGGIYADGGADDFTIDSCEISNNNTKTTGGGLYLGGETHITDTTITGNKSSSRAAGFYLWGNDSILFNVTVSGNICEGSSDCTGAVELGLSNSENDYSIEISKCTFENNNAVNTIYIYGGGKPVLFDDCTIKKNESDNATIYFGSINPASGLTMAKCNILNNTAGVAGAIMDDSYGVTVLTEITVTGNTSTETNDDPKTGGIYIDKSKGEVTVTVSSVTDNTIADGSINNWYVSSNSKVSFDADRKVARINDTSYESIASAVEAAVSEATIHLIAGEEDEYGAAFSSANVTINKAVSIDLNDRTINLPVGEALFTVESDGELTLVNAGVINGGIAVENNGSLTLNCQVKELVISLADGGSITAGDEIDCESIRVSLSESMLNDLNDSQKEQEDIVLIKGAGGDSDLSDLVDKITIEGLTNPLISIESKNGNLVLHKKILTGIFIDGVNGNDENDSSYENPVKTFARAKKLLQNSDYDTIYVLNTISITTDETWELGEGKIITRYPTYKGYLVEVNGTGTGASLTLKNIVIDGAREYVNDSRSMIYMHNGGNLTIEEGAVLQNNDVSYNNSSYRGGAIYNSGGELMMNGGTIQNCSAIAGGGVYLIDNTYDTTKTTFIFKTGAIVNNSCYKGKNEILPSGGGILIDGWAAIEMRGGTISGNEATYGGGIALGGHSFTVNTQQNTMESFTMDGGTIQNNKAGNSGGGIFVQCTFNATICAGIIANNTCGSGNFGGGGIYVNGGKEEHKNGRLLLYNVLIANNTTKYDSSTGAGGGAGIAGCSTSDVRQFIIDGGVIYQNTANGQKDDILISNSNGAGYTSQAPTESYISEFMLGGGTYLWKRVGTGEHIGVNYLHTAGVKKVYTDRTDEDACIKNAKKAAKVFITGNTATYRGGGIGSNGDVYIGGDSEDTINISVTKKWVDDDNAENLRPDSVRIWLLRNGEKVSCLEFQPDRSGEWPDTLEFTDQLPVDADGNAYEYTVEEEIEELKNVYTSKAEKGTDDNTWTVTNTLITTGSLHVSKTVSGSGSKRKDFSFTVTLSDAAINGTYGDMTFQNGVAAFTLRDGQSVTASGLPDGTKYTVEERNPGGYTVTVNGTEETKAAGVITARQTSKAAFNNDLPGVVPEPTPASAKVTLTAEKTLDGAVPDGDNYTFVLKDENGEIIQTQKNHGGSITFDSLLFDKTGEFTYYITELAGDDSGIVYDTSTYKVIVAVTKPGDYVASVSYEKDGEAYSGTPVFENTTASDPGKEDPDDPGKDDPDDPGKDDPDDPGKDDPDDPGKDNPDDPGKDDPDDPGKEDPDDPGKEDPGDSGGTGAPNDPDHPSISIQSSNQEPQTGDNTCISLWAVLMAVSFIGICVSVFIGRKKRHRGTYRAKQKR